MELSEFDIIKKAIVTNKSVDLFKKFGQITFEVNKLANKLTVRKAIEKIWNVKVSKVCVINRIGKNRVFSKKSFKLPDRKRVIVTLKKGYKIDIPGMFESVVAQSAAPLEASASESSKV
jgi:large subunit ribosomal protein L23